MFHNESWKLIYFGAKKSKIKVTRHKNRCRRRFLYSCDCWLLVVIVVCIFVFRIYMCVCTSLLLHSGLMRAEVVCWCFCKNIARCAEFVICENMRTRCQAAAIYRGRAVCRIWERQRRPEFIWMTVCGAGESGVAVTTSRAAAERARARACVCVF